MPVVFDSVLAAALARELDGRWSGRRLEAVRFEPEARRVRLVLRDETWIWLLHPRDGVLARLEEWTTGDGRERGRRDRGASGDRGVLDGPRRIAAVAAPPDTRRIEVSLDGPDGASERLVFDLVTNRWNALHVVDGRVRAVLVPGLGREPAAPGDRWEPEPSRRRWAEEAPGRQEWEDTLVELAGPEARRIRGRVAWMSAMNEAYVLGGPVDPGDPADVLARYMTLRDAALRDPPAGWLHPETGDVADGEAGVRPYAAGLDAVDAERAGTPLDALEAVARRSRRISAELRAATESPETTALREALAERRDRLEKKIRALEAEVGEGRDPEELRALGHLLLARKREIRTGAAEARLEDFTGEQVTVSLDPSLDVVGNAEAYYDRARRQERAAAELPRRIRTAERRLAKLEDAIGRVQAGEADDGAWKLAGGKGRILGRAGGGPGGATAKRGGEALPYRVYRTSSGREVRAGRSAKGNDELTFHHSAPDDIWMHVREAPGSHVVLRWGNRDQNPPAADIAEAALVAAVLSRARGSNVVPVAWTRRKYVRKPRKAPPGTVAPERTQTVFVRPDAKQVARMAADE